MLNTKTSANEGKAKDGRFSRLPSRHNVSLGTLFGVISIVLYFSYNAGFLSGKTKVPELQNVDPKVRDFVAELQKENTTLKQKIIIAERNYQIHVEAQKALGNHLKSLQQQNTELMRDMALYQTIAGTPATGQGLEIKAFHLYTTEEPNTFRYLLVLSKQAAAQKYVQGAVKMTIMGHIGQQAIQLPVKYVDSTREDGLAFKFRHLQELAGELSFPEQFMPEEVVFQVTPDKDWPTLSQNFPWSIENTES